jgi:hypothetical protein
VILSGGVPQKMNIADFNELSEADALPFGLLWYAEPDATNNAIGYAKFYSRAHDAVIRVYDEAWNLLAIFL